MIIVAGRTKAQTVKMITPITPITVGHALLPFTGTLSEKGYLAHIEQMENCYCVVNDGLSKADGGSSQLDIVSSMFPLNF